MTTHLHSKLSFKLSFSFLSALIFLLLPMRIAQAALVANDINFSELKPAKITANGNVYRYRVNLKTAEPREQRVVKVKGVDTNFYKALDGWFYSMNWSPSEIFKDYPAWRLDSKSVPPEEDYLLPSYEISTTDPKVAVSDLGYELSVRGKRFKPGEGAGNGPNGEEKITFEDWGANFTGLAIEDFSPSIQIKEVGGKQTYLGSSGSISLKGTTTAGRKIENGKETVYKYTYEVAVLPPGETEWVVIRDYIRNAQHEIAPGERSGLLDHQEIAQWNVSESKADGTRKFPPGTYTVRLTVKPETGGQEGSVTTQVRILALDIAAASVSESDEEKRGAVVMLNNDNDDFGIGQYEPDLEQQAPEGVPNENDLQAVTLQIDPVIVDNPALKAGTMRLETTGDEADHLTVWNTGSKTGVPLIAAGGAAKTWTVAQFNALASKTFYVEGYKRSNDVRKSVLKLSYVPPAGINVQLTDQINYTVVELMLDVNRDAQLTDETPTYQPGYSGNAPVITNANNWRQQMQLIVAPLSLGTEVDSVAGKTTFSFTQLSRIPGVAMNSGNQTGGDYTFSTDDDITNEITTTIDNRAVQDFYCNDYGATAIVKAEIYRGNQVLATCELRVPLDSDRDLLPDFWETANESDPQRDNAQIFNAKDPQTKPLLPGLPAVAAATWDQETQNPAASGNPANGRLGDGLIAYEEYRGFFYGDNDNTNHRHYRTSPHEKDVFVWSRVRDINAAKTQMNLGYLPNIEPTVHIHRINDQEWDGDEIRSINFNRHELGATLQRAIYIDDVPRPIFNAIGYTYPQLNAGANGVCNTEVAGPPFLDKQSILLNQGLKDQVALTPGLNGMIDPYIETGDTLDADNLRIVSNTDDGHLHTFAFPIGIRANGYTPDDRVRGNISGVAGILEAATINAVHANDRLTGEIRNGPDGKLEDATVANVSTQDSLENVVIHPGNDEMQSIRAADDVANPDGTIGPGMNKKFDTPKAAGDEFRGAIISSADNILQSRPATADDIVAGTIEEGGDNILQSRPAVGTTDFVIGYVEDGGNGFLDPTLNNADADVDGSGGVKALLDDIYDPATQRVMTGPDGIRNTLLQLTADDIQIISNTGYGTPYALCIDPDNDDGVGQGFDQIVDTAPVGDDRATLAGGINPSNTNDTGYIIIVVKGLDTVFGVAQAVPGVAGQYQEVPFDCQLISGAVGTTNRQQLLRLVMAHEAGHAMDIEHYSQTFPVIPGAVNRYTATPAPGHTVNGSVMFLSPANIVLPIPSTFDDTDKSQIRSHVKHP